MLEVLRRLRTNAATMAAYDVFLRDRWTGWFMQNIGCFSVDREGSDSQAMKCAVDILVKGERGLTIFPEGNVMLMNDRVTPFLGGAAFIGMRAQKKLGPDKPIYVIPTSLKFSHLTDCRSRIARLVESLENQLGICTSDRSIRSRLRNVGLQILTRNLRQRGYVAPCDDHDDLQATLESSATQIIEKLEQKMDLASAGDDPPAERIRRIRSAIHQVRIDEKQQLDHRVAATWADEAILASRILSYSGDYLRESPSIDRHSETVEKLREDLAERILAPVGDRGAIVQFGQPVNLADHLDALRKSSREALANLTQQFELSVQHGLDELNAVNDLPGSKLLD